MSDYFFFLHSPPPPPPYLISFLMVRPLFVINNIGLAFPVIMHYNGICYLFYIFISVKYVKKIQSFPTGVNSTYVNNTFGGLKS